MHEFLKALKDFEQLAIQLSLTIGSVAGAMLFAFFAISGALRTCRDELRHWQSPKTTPPSEKTPGISAD